MRKHLVTGGSGFLGHLIVKRLQSRGESVRVLDLWKDPSLSRDVEFVMGDVRDRSVVSQAMQGIDIVHHTAALVPLTKSGKKFWDVNVIGSQIVAEEAVNARITGFIHMSSSAVYGLPKQVPITNKTPLAPVEIYGRSKLAGEQAVRKIFQEAESPYIIIRPRTILGEGRLGIFQILFEWMKEGRNIYTIGSGDIQFQFVHAHDLMDAYMLLLDVGEMGEFNIGAKEFGTLREALQNLIVYAGSSTKLKVLPVGITIGALKVLDFLNLSPLAPWHYQTYHKDFSFDVNHILDLGWQPKYSNDRMFKESYDWFLAMENRSKCSGDHRAVHRKPVREKLIKLLKFIS